MSTKVRLIDIAQAAGVSVSAVSKALGNSSELPQATKDRILDYANRLGYRPNFTARSLRLGRSNLLGVLIPDITNAYYASILKGIEAKARSYGFTTIITITNEDSEIEKNTLDAFLSVPVDGILSVPIDLNNYAPLEIPLVLLSRYPFFEGISYPAHAIPNKEFNYVLSNDFKGQYLATNHLLSCQLQEVYLILGEASNKVVAGMKSAIRLSAYKEALKENQVPFDPSKVFYHGDVFSSVYDITDQICKTARRPFAISLTNDSTAVSAYSAIFKNGLSIPKDVQIVGYDDIEISRHFFPELTTIHSAKQSIGEQGVSLIADFIGSDKPNRSKIRTIFDPYLIERQTTAFVE